MNDCKDANVFGELQEALEASIAYSQGKLSLPATKLPAPPPVPAPAHIATLRRRYNMSQTVFAAVLSVSVRTLQAWEQGRRTPNQASARLLQILETEPEVMHKIAGIPDDQN